jgi:predicted O-methyltransferase YrrM
MKSPRFLLNQRLGQYIARNNFYSPIPYLKELNEDLWSRHSELIGINSNEKNQLELLSSFASTYRDEYEQFPLEKTAILHEYYVNNGMFESVDGEFLYCMIRRFKPRRLIEIGSGFSTRLIVQSILKNKEVNDQYECRVTTIDPFPSGIVRKSCPHFSSLQLIYKKVQDVPLSEFSKLSENDILFIDSSHVLKTGSDVAYEYLEILPRLNKGVLIHVHDIFLPADYPKAWLFDSNLFFNEQYLLQALLAFNNNFEVLWAGSYIHLNYPDALEKAFNSYTRAERWPGSFWIRKVD